MAAIVVDHYAVLQLPKSPPPSQEDVQNAYRRLARQLHPDRNKSPDATAQFQAVQKAYETLRDPLSRQVPLCALEILPHFVKLYDDLGPESDQYATSLAAVAKTRYGRWLLSDWRWLIGVLGWLFIGYLNRNWLYFPLHWVVPALGAPWFGPAIFVREVLQASHWRYPTAYAHSIIAALSLVIQFLPVSWLTAITKFTCLLFCLGLGVTLKDDRDIPLVLFIASFFYDFTGKQHNTFLNRLLGAHALLAYIVSLLPLAVLLGSPRYPRPSYLTPLLIGAFHRALPVLRNFVLLPVAILLGNIAPPFLASLLLVMVPVWVLNYFFSFPTEWLLVIVLRFLCELTAPTFRQLGKRVGSVTLTALAWYFIAPRVGLRPWMLNAILYSYLVRQACALADLPKSDGSLPPRIRYATVLVWLVFVCIDSFLRNISSSYPRYEALAAAFSILGCFDIVEPPPESEMQQQEDAAAAAANGGDAAGGGGSGGGSGPPNQFRPNNTRRRRAKE